MEDRIEFKMYGQDGKFIPMSCENTDSSRRLVEWIRRHDRYTAEKSPQASS